MALRRLVVALGAVALLPGCSLVLDPDELTAARADGEVDQIGDGTAETHADGADTDGAPVKRIIVDHSGMVACTFDYRIGLTQCPESCAPGWTYVVDASRSTGVGAFAWTFEATGGFSVTPSDAVGPRVELSIGTPECLIGGTNMRPFTILARLSTDGGAAAPVELPPIGVGQVVSCSGEGSCPDP